MIVDFDDFGADHILSNTTRTRDCRRELDKLHYAQPELKVTLFAVPMEMTPELLKWCEANKSWIELGVHGFYHNSNYECEKLTAEEFNEKMMEIGYGVLDQERTPFPYKKLFKAPGWQISDGAYTWLLENNWMIADQGYNDGRRPKEIPAYVNYDGKFAVVSQTVGNEPWHVEAWHGHVWDCCGNGIQETFDQVKHLVEQSDSFQFVTEVLQ